MANILVAEDDEYFRLALKNILVSRGHKVTEAENGKIAREVINASEPFDIILSDIQMPFLNGVELLEWVKKNRPSPFILMTGFSLIMETKKAHELGADEFLAKPFNEKELMAALGQFVKKEAVATEPAPPPKIIPEYCKVSLEEFVSTKKIMFDVYVQLGSKYVKIGRKGDDVPLERISHYREKGLRYLHVLKEDFRQLVGFSLNIAKSLKSNDNVSKEKKANFLRYTGEVVLETAFIKGIDQDAFDDAKDFLTTSMDVLADDKESFDLISMLNSHADYIYAHSLCVSMYAVMIAKKLGWTSTQTLFKISLSGIFHDIGKKEIDREILDKQRALLSQAERRLIETHPSRGHEILMLLPTIPSEVARVAYEHHEDNHSTGYPRRIGKHDFHPLTQVIRVANIFSEHVLKSPSRAAMEPSKAIEHMTTHFAGSIDTQAFRALKQLFPTDPKIN